MMDNELKVWKSELEIRKERNNIAMKEIKQQLASLNCRKVMLIDCKNELKSNIYFEIEEKITQLQLELNELKNENSDIGSIIYSIDIEVGDLIMCD